MSKRPAPGQVPLKIANMDIASDNTATLAVVLIATGLLGWGWYRSRAYGKLGLLSWLQSVALLAPWLIFFGLFSAGVYLNLAAMLLLIAVSTGAYIFLGSQLRSTAQAQSQRWQQAAESGEDGDLDGEPPNPLMVDRVPVPPEEMKVIQGIFGIDTFFATETIPYLDGAIFKGNLRGEPSEVRQQLSDRLEEKLGDRYRIFLVANPDGKPVVVILPSSNDPKPLTTGQKLLAAVLFVATLFTTLETAALLQGFDLFGNFDRFGEVLPLSMGIWIILGVHELGHQLMASRRQVRLSLPFFLPTWQIGSFGAINQFLSLLPNRDVLFDVAIAGPAAGMGLSGLLLVAGLLMSGDTAGFQLPSEFFQGSVLVGTLAKTTLGDALQNPIVGVHPLAIVGWIGLVLNAINLMPAGQLDGGRIVQAIYGRKVLGRMTVATLIVLAIASFANILALYWAVLILFLQRQPERPALEELNEPDDTRAALGLLALFLMLATLIPLSPSLAGRLGIGA